VALTAGSKLGPYEILAPLGAGGMGEVYRARDPRLDREVAIKVLPEEVATDPDRLRRFEKEAKAAGALDHPNILIVHDVGTHEDSPYVVTELLKGETLRDRMAGSVLPPDKAVEYGIQIARRLAAAHDEGIVHRDLKPENLFVTKDGLVKILDFGIAKVIHRTPAEGDAETAAITSATDAGTVLGTVGYMSPEQVRGDGVDHRSDIFSFGAVLYESASSHAGILPSPCRRPSLSLQRHQRCARRFTAAEAPIQDGPRSGRRSADRSHRGLVGDGARHDHGHPAATPDHSPHQLHGWRVRPSDITGRHPGGIHTGRVTSHPASRRTAGRSPSSADASSFTAISISLGQMEPGFDA